MAETATAELGRRVVRYLYKAQYNYELKVRGVGKVTRVRKRETLTLRRRS
jgi:hypothetical protein